jgi:hypothetical protein
VAADRERPDRRDVLHNLLALYVAKRDRPDAEAVAARIGAGGTAEDAVWAEEAVARLDLRESDEAVAAKDYERALALLRSAREKIHDDALKARIDDHVAALERAVAERKKEPRPPAPRPGAPKR